MDLGTLIVILVAIVVVAVVLVILFQIGIFSVFATKEAVEGEVNIETPDGSHLIGRIATARTDLDPEGMVFVFGERWRARADNGPVREGAQVRVKSVDGMVLNVEPVSED